MIPVLFILAGVLILAAPDDIPSELFKQKFSFTPRVFHHPPEVMFENRPQDIDLFVDFPQDSLESVMFYFRTDKMNKYQEVHLDMFRQRYHFRFDPNDIPAEILEYFFIVTLKDFSLFAEPLDKNGFIQPIRRKLRDPIEYYREKIRSRK